MTTRTLLLMRHGKSDWQAGAADDFSRPLTKRGKRNSTRIGQWLAGHDLKPDILIASPAARTLQTGARVCKALGMEPGQIVQDERLYLADATTLLEVIRRLPSGVHTAMLIGHNPGLEELLAGLLGEATPLPADGKLMPTAALAQLRFSAGWPHQDAGQVQLVKLLRARYLDEQ